MSVVRQIIWTGLTASSERCSCSAADDEGSVDAPVPAVKRSDNKALRDVDNTATEGSRSKAITSAAAGGQCAGLLPTKQHHGHNEAGRHNSSVNNDRVYTAAHRRTVARGKQADNDDQPSRVRDQPCRRQRHRVRGSSLNRQHRPGFPSNIRPVAGRLHTPRSPANRHTVYRWQK